MKKHYRKIWRENFMLEHFGKARWHKGTSNSMLKLPWRRIAKAQGFKVEKMFSDDFKNQATGQIGGPIVRESELKKWCADKPEDFESPEFLGIYQLKGKISHDLQIKEFKRSLGITGASWTYEKLSGTMIKK